MLTRAHTRGCQDLAGSGGITTVMALREQRRRRITIQRSSVTRPSGAPRSFACPGCDFVLWEEIDYTWCPKCGLDVDWIDPRLPVWCCATCDELVNEDRDAWPRCTRCETVMSRVHAVEEPIPDRNRGPGLAIAFGQTVYLLALVAQVIVLALDPIGRAFLAPLIALGVLGAGLMIVAVASGLGELGAVVRDRRTRVIHGLEHACLELLRRDGHRIHGGQTTTGMFEIEIENAGRASLHAVTEATRTAIQRIDAGDHALAYSRQCGTSLLVALLLLSVVVIGGAVIALVAGVRTDVVIAGTAAMGLVAWLASRPLGLLAQRTLTVSTRFKYAVVREVTRVISADGRRARFVVRLAVGARGRE
jgi:hypothetical protein